MGYYKQVDVSFCGVVGVMVTHTYRPVRGDCLILVILSTVLPVGHYIDPDS